MQTSGTVHLDFSRLSRMTQLTDIDLKTIMSRTFKRFIREEMQFFL